MMLLDLLLPPACTACGRTGAVLCRTCVAAFQPPARVDDRFVVADPGVVIGEALTIGLAAFRYAGPVQRALAALKYSGAARAAPMLAQAAVPVVRGLLVITGPASLIPVPIHVERRRARGYNQADLLARALGRELGVPVEQPLLRVRSTTKQHRLNRSARLLNLRGAFVQRPASNVPHAAILVDDIITTTATLEACASVLRGAGCQEVYGFAIAREV